MKVINKSGRKKVWVIALAVIVIGVVAIFVYLKFGPNNKSTVTNPVTTQESTVNNKQQDVALTQNDNKQLTENLGSNESSSQAVKAPSGTFVSNHRPNLDGDPAPSSINSVCSTSVGAKCEIRFSKDGVVKNLEGKVVGDDGFVSWDWTVQDLNLTVGTWQIEAFAQLGENSASTKDQIPLEVEP